MPSPALIALAALAAASQPVADGVVRRVEARSGEAVTLEPPDGIPPEKAHWVELSGPSMLLKKGEARGPTLEVRPPCGGVYRFACLPDESASLLRASLFEVRVNEASSAPRAVCPILVCAGEEVVVEADCAPGFALRIVRAAWKQLSGPRLALSRDELRRTTLRLTPELPGRYRFALKVHGCDGRATFTFEVPPNSRGGPERRPFARIAPVGRARAGEEVVLDGTRSADPDGGALTFHWKQTGGVVVKLGTSPGGEGSRVRFVPARAGDYAFALTVADEAGFRSRPGGVVVTVLPPTEPARADPVAADPLDRPLSVRLENEPASVLLARLAEAGVTVRASKEVTRTHPFGTFRVDLWAVDLPARKVLDWLGRMIGAFYVIERPGVVWYARGTRWLELERPAVVRYRIDALYTEDDASDLMRLLEEPLKGALWTGSGLGLGQPDLAADTITAVLPRSAQSRLGRVLAELRREVPSGPPADEAGPPLGRLMSRTVRARYREWPVREIAWDLARQARVPVGFAPLGKDGGKRISLDPGEVPLREALHGFCRAAGFAGHKPEPPGAVWLFTKSAPPETSECLWSAAEVRSYDLRQLRAAHGFAGPMVAHLVKSRVMPGRWKDPFVSVGYSPARERLLVVHSAEVHLAVADLLARLAREGEKALAD